ncbi:MAG: hypothetical protein ACE5GS_02505 [Kiloniellaceae bacterium]
MSRIAAGGVAFAFALAACAAPEEPVPAPEPAAEIAPEPVAEATPDDAADMAPGAGQSEDAAPRAGDSADAALRAEAEAVATKTAAPPPEPAIDDDPDRLLGLDRGALGALLGEPALIRREPPAEIWQYRGATCIFDVFLYEEAGRDRVTYLEARDTAAQTVEARGCFNELLRARLGLPLG